MERVSVIKKLLFFVLILSGLDFTAGQDTVTLEGYVRDTSGRAVPYATVTLWRIPEEVGEMTVDKALSEGWEMTGGGVSDTGGYYRVASLEPGRYLLECKHIVYKAARKEMEVGKDPVEGDFILYPKSEMLAELKVEGSRLRYTAGEYKINLSESEMVRNRTAGESLGLLPGLMYKDGELLLDGQPVAIIYIDGREVRNKKVLEWMQGESVEEVSVENQAGSAHSARIKGGVVRIETKQQDGYGGNLIFSPFYAPNKEAEDSYGGNLYVPFGVHFGKFSLTNEFSFSPQTSDNVEKERAESKHQGIRWMTDRVKSQRNYGLYDQLNMVYEVDPRKTIGFVGAVSYNDAVNRTSSMSRPERMGKTEGNTLSYGPYRYDVHDKNREFGLLFAADYAQVFDSMGSGLSVKADYVYYSIRDENRYQTDWIETDTSLSASDLYKQWLPRLQHNVTARADYRHVFRSGRGLDAGLTYEGKYANDSYRTEVFQNGVWIEDPDRQSGYDVHTTQATAYAVYRDRYGKFSYSLGGSLQWDALAFRSSQENSFSRRNYIQPFANLSFGYDFNSLSGTNINLDLSRYSGQMPSYRQLSSREERVSENQYYVGNKNLQLPTGYRGRLTYVWRGKWRFFYVFQAEKGSIYDVTEQEAATGKVRMYPMNGDWAYDQTLGLSWNQSLAKWFRVGLNTSMEYVRGAFVDNQITYKDEMLRWRFAGQFMFQIMPSMGIDVSVYYDTPYDFLGMRFNHDLVGLFSVYKTFFNDSFYLAVSCRLRAWDVLMASYALDGSYSSNIRYVNYPLQTISLTLNWKFGRDGLKLKQAQATQQLESR